MKKTLAISILTLFLLSTFIVLNNHWFGLPVNASPTTWTVGPLGSGADFTKIQDAVNAASPMDDIQVWPGVYTENVIVNRSVNLYGAGLDVTVVNASNPNSHVFDIQVDSVKLAGFKITNATEYYCAGVYASGRKFLNISGNQLELNYYGIRLSFSSNNSVSGNKMTKNVYGVELDFSSHYNLVSGNNITANSYGIELYSDSNYNFVSGNNMTANSYYGIMLSSDSNYNSVSGNNITANSYGIKLAYSNYNSIYNNLFSSTVNAWDNGFNYWNISKTVGKNIVGGPYLGGNYWNDYLGADLDWDGLGDTILPYNCSGNITSGGDWLPLTSPYGIKNWTVVELLPASENNKAGRTMPVKFVLRVSDSVDPTQPFVYNEELTLKIYATSNPSSILQTSKFGNGARDYRIDIASEHYITNFKTLKTPMQYNVTIYQDAFLIGSFSFQTVK